MSNLRPKLLLVFGTRPEAIKMAPLCKALEAERASFETRICVTGQHREMLDQVLGLFRIVPDYDLDLMQAGQRLSHVTSAILSGLEPIIEDFRPDCILVHGDTTTAFAASLVAFYMNIKIAHVEAGLRTTTIYAPFPEEFNRRATSLYTNIHFAPTKLAKENLLSEGGSPQHIHVTGNTVIDALLLTCKIIDEDIKLARDLGIELKQAIGDDWNDGRVVLVTGHRRENIGSRLLNICNALRELALAFQDIKFVYPVHLNPKVRGPVQAQLGDLANIRLIKPLGYQAFVELMRRCSLVLTDSGGIQEEAPSLAKPVLVMRDETERPEALLAGTAKLVGSHEDKIVTAVSELLRNEDAYAAMSSAQNPYGDGTACRQIVQILKEADFENI